MAIDPHRLTPMGMSFPRITPVLPTMTRILSAMLCAGLLAMAAPAMAQRASLAERVAALEQQAANNQGNVDLLNQVTTLRSDVQALRAQIEDLQHQNEQLRQSSHDQYLDLDGRLTRIEGGTAASTTPRAAPTAAVEKPSAP